MCTTSVFKIFKMSEDALIHITLLPSKNARDAQILSGLDKSWPCINIWIYQTNYYHYKIYFASRNILNLLFLSSTSLLTITTDSLALRVCLLAFWFLRYFPVGLPDELDPADPDSPKLNMLGSVEVPDIENLLRCLSSWKGSNIFKILKQYYKCSQV